MEAHEEQYNVMWPRGLQQKKKGLNKPGPSSTESLSKALWQSFSFETPFLSSHIWENHCQRYRRHRGEKAFKNLSELPWLSKRVSLFPFFTKWGEPLRHKIDLEWEHHIESKYNRLLNAALGWELIEREWDNVFPIQKALIEERNPSRNLFVRLSGYKEIQTLMLHIL